MPKYPHMSPKEEELWDRYLAWSPHRFLKLTYDLHLGDHAPIDPGWPEWLVRLVKATSMLRVDVIGETADAVYIFEVKDRAGMNALGQLMTYERLYIEEYHPTKPVKKVAICESIRSDMAVLLPEWGIEVIVV